MIHSVACCFALAIDTLEPWLMLDEFYFVLEVHPRAQSSPQKQVPFAARWFCRRASKPYLMVIYLYLQRTVNRKESQRGCVGIPSVGWQLSIPHQ